MRKRLAVLAVLSALVFVPSADASVSASVSPTSVDFGRVGFDNGCNVDLNGLPNEFCSVRTLTVTNTGTEVLFGAGGRACEDFLEASNTCVTAHASWGGFNRAGSTCFIITIAPGESCTVVLVAGPSRPGLIRGFATVEMAAVGTGESAPILVVPIRLLAIPQ
jgi:hypothetical protein